MGLPSAYAIPHARAMKAIERELVLHCVASYKQGRSKVAPLIDIDEMLNTRFLLAMLAHVPMSDAMALWQGSRLRARALALSREGRPDDAESMLHQASAAAATAPETTLAVRSLHSAAEAYLRFQLSDHDRAEALLVDALDACRLLHDRHDILIEARRVHLARNIIRVRSSAGRLASALDMACRLVRYVGGESLEWPIPEVQLATRPDALSVPDQLSLLDQVVSEISRLTRDARGAALVAEADPALFDPEATLGPRLARVHLRLSAISGLVAQNLIRWLESGVIFFGDGPGYMPRAWREMSTELATICEQLAPEMTVEVAP
jgi:hypothetical protein